MPSADVVHTKDPLNAEPNLADLTASQVTPSSLMFHRNHGPTPAEAVAALSSPTGAADWRIEFIIQPGMEGLEPAIRSVTLKEIWDQSEEVEQTIALQCAGNRRDLFSHGHQSTEGIAWEQGTVANAAWSGALLKPLLSRFLLHEQQPPAGSHVVFESYQDCGVDEGGVYGGSVRTEVMWQDDAPVILAWKQDGEPLHIEHGGPVRVVVPGHIGARSVKWLARIKISPRPAPHHAQQQDYKVIHPTHTSITAKEKEALMDRAPPMDWCTIQCVIGSAAKEDDGVRVKGYALGEKGVPIQSIHLALVSAPPGVRQPSDLFQMEESLTEQAEKQDRWHVVRLNSEPGSKNWGWFLWEDVVRLPVPQEDSTWVVVAKAVDVNGKEQTRWPEWNLRGVGFDGWSVRPVSM